MSTPRRTKRRGGVILAEIGAHPVDAAVVHEVGFLKAALASDDIVPGHDDVAGAICESLRLWRSFFVSENCCPAEQRKTDHRDDQQDPFKDVADRIDGWLGE